MLRGYHLIIDGWQASPAKLASLDTVYDFLDRCPDLIHMTKIMPPYCFRFTPLPPVSHDEAGISGFVIIAESHISVHTYPERSYLAVDIFSCRPFEPGAGIDFIIECFQVRTYNHQWLDRGLDYPRSLHLAREVCLQERLQIQRR